ncbi:MAG TPA: winged helix-turn-helix domain-containing protein [Candidatus Nitrosotalea sp.]|nr:winged helix-turn-helix domain-containing protein [Candidatus Nitrosotalea sp.]HEU5488910.1 winged helix-turn-helix domain-containing protein [Candidatus Nitrosotalea sp.]
MKNYTEQSVMGWGNRGWVEIIETILEVCESGALKTHIMYKCNLNSKQISQYLQFLQNHKLIESMADDPFSKRAIFRTTPDLGRKYMEAYKRLAAIFKH